MASNFQNLATKLASGDSFPNYSGSWQGARHLKQPVPRIRKGLPFPPGGLRTIPRGRGLSITKGDHFPNYSGSWQGSARMPRPVLRNGIIQL